MKKHLAFLFMFLIMLSSCSKIEEESLEISSEPSIEQSSVSEEQEEPAEPEKTEEKAPEHLSYLREDFPKIDGSTSLIPLEAGIRAEIFGKTMEEATLDVEHSSTWDSFYSLTSGEADMIFSVPLSEQQWEYADKQGIMLEAIPVAYEGFVFVVNANNPVDVLTQQQLRDIYSGKITNWKEVGGNDAEIIAYQRNNDSGSQNYMIEFMGDVPLMDAPKEKRPGSMSGLMDVIAVNDNAENAIGYSVYAYAADMYGNGDEIKFIKVDGAEVNKNSMAKGEYPLMGYNYAVFDSKKAEDSNVRKLVEWMISDEGQLAVAKAGYVTLRDIGFDYSETVIEKLEATGTGIKKPEGKLASYRYLAIDPEQGYSKYYYPGISLSWDGKYYYLNSLSDKSLQDEVNDFIAEKTDELKKYESEFKDYINRMNGEEEYGVYQIAYSYPGENRQGEEPITVTVKAENGYLYAVVTLRYWYSVQEGYEHYYKTETAIWDMESGKRLELGDLFYEGIDINEVLNKYLAVKSAEKVDAYYTYEKKADFMSIPKEGFSITPEGIYFDYGNPYFAEGVFISFENLPEGIFVTEQPEDMEKYFSGNDVGIIKIFRDIKHKWNYKYLNGDLTYYMLLPEDSYPTAKKINSEVEEYLKKYYKADVIEKFMQENDLPYENIEDVLWFSDWWTVDYGGKYVVFSGGSLEYYEVIDGVQHYKNADYPYDKSLIFEIETGERIDYEDMLSEQGRAKIAATPFGRQGKKLSYLYIDDKIRTGFEHSQVDTYLEEDDIRW